MGRRALPKVDRSIDIGNHYCELEETACPFIPDAEFPNTDDLDAKSSAHPPLHIEVGSGKGLFLLNQSGDHPKSRFLGIEIAKKYARFAAYRFAKHQRKNARIIRGDALKFFHEYLQSDIADTVHVYFPDPWWKERHRRRRVMQPEFINNAFRVLKPNCALHFWTDVEEYFESTCELVKVCSKFSDPEPIPERTADHQMDYQTHFERRMRLNDHPVWRVKFWKKESVPGNAG